jgi:hypothetical protein
MAFRCLYSALLALAFCGLGCRREETWPSVESGDIIELPDGTMLQRWKPLAVNLLAAHRLDIGYRVGGQEKTVTVDDPSPLLAHLKPIGTFVRITRPSVGSRLRRTPSSHGSAGLRPGVALPNR